MPKKGGKGGSKNKGSQGKSTPKKEEPKKEAPKEEVVVEEAEDADPEAAMKALAEKERKEKAERRAKAKAEAESKGGKSLGGEKDKKKSTSVAYDFVPGQNRPTIKATGKGKYTLEVMVTAGNCKRMDPDAYGVVDRHGWVKLELAGETAKTTRIRCLTLDPMWEETFEMAFDDLKNDKLKTTFYLGDLQIGMPAEYNLDKLIKMKHTYKGMAVMGGKVDLTLRALNFGDEEEEEEEDDTFFDMLGGDMGGSGSDEGEDEDEDEEDEDEPPALVEADKKAEKAGAGGVNVVNLRSGDNENFPKRGDRLTMHYTGSLKATGAVFDSSVKRGQPFEFQIGVGSVIRGWDEGILQMSLGQKAKLEISSEYGYGASGSPGAIPPDSDLDFEVELLAINNVKSDSYRAEHQKRMAGERAAIAEQKAKEEAAALESFMPVSVGASGGGKKKAGGKKKKGGKKK